MRFLVVDDSSTMRRIIINTLNKLGYKECHEAGNGREGVEKLATTPVDMVITDWNMPGMQGIDLLRAVRADPQMKAMPVLLPSLAVAATTAVPLLRSRETAAEYPEDEPSVSQVARSVKSEYPRLMFTAAMSKLVRCA